MITLEAKKAEEIANRAIQDHLSVRDVENIVRGIELSKNNKKKEKPEKSKASSPFGKIRVQEMERRMPADFLIVHPEPGQPPPHDEAYFVS